MKLFQIYWVKDEQDVVGFIMTRSREEALLALEEDYNVEPRDVVSIKELRANHVWTQDS